MLWRCAALVCLISAAASAEIIDRIAVTVDRKVITESEILRQIRITAFLNGEQPDFSSENKRRTAERLVEQALIRREIETSRYTTGGETSSKPLHDNLRARFGSAGEYERALANYGITDAEVKAALDWQAMLLEFVEVRFRPAVQVPETEIRQYYESEVLSKPGQQPPFEAAREQVEAILTQQYVDNALDRWLGQARTQTRIRFKEEVFR